MKGHIDRTLDPYMLRFEKSNPPMTRGHVLSFLSLIQITGIDRPLRLRSRLDGFYRRRGLTIKQRGESFILRTAAEQVKDADKELIAGKRRMKRAIENVMVIPAEELTPEENSHRERTLDVHQRILAAQRAASQEVKYIVGNNNVSALTA